MTRPTLPVELQAQLVAIDDVRPLDTNPRRGDVDFLRESIRRHGQYAPIIVRRETGEILKGNHTWHAVKAEGLDQVAVIYRSIERDEDAQRFALADNRASDLAVYDMADLAQALAALDDLDGSGYDVEDLNEVLAAADAALDSAAAVRELPTPPPPADPVTRPGDVIRLGDHRLMCGDALDPVDVARLLRGDYHPAQLAILDPPYGVEYRDRGLGSEEVNTRVRQLQRAATIPRFDMIDGDQLQGDELLAFVTVALETIAAHTEPTAALYLWHGWPAGLFEQAIAESGYVIRSPIVWAKSHAAFTRAQYKGHFEHAYYCHRRDAAPAWYGDRRQTSLWHAQLDQMGTYQHPTQKPVKLAEIALRNSSRPGDVVLDFMAGAGGVLLAAEQLARAARCMELSPAYCDVIVSRWEDLTGRKAKRPKRSRATARPARRSRRATRAAKETDR